MAGFARFKIDFKGIRKVALQGDGIRELITEKTMAGAEDAAATAGVEVEELLPKLGFGNNRFYGTYGTYGSREAKTGALSGSVKGMRG